MKIATDKTVVTKKMRRGRVIQITVSTDIKLSLDYNSIGTTIGMTRTIGEKEDVNQVVMLLDSKIEKALQNRVPGIKEALRKASQWATGNSSR